MASFPTLSSGSVTMNPATHGVQFDTAVVSFRSGKEQRWARRAPLNRWTLIATNVSKTDADSIISFFDSVKGEYDSTWDVTVGATTYENMAFSGDTLTVLEAKRNLFTITVECRQTRKN